MLVDDAELVADHEFAALMELVPHAQDIGMHLVVARKSGGFSRASFQPLLGGLRDQNPLAVVLSADREEGAIFGVKPQAAAPGRAVIPGIGQVQLALPTQNAGGAEGGDR
ncbi:hypothetical protein [Corynebacterium atypicum]